MSASQSLGSWEEAVQWLRAQPDQLELIRAAYYDDPLQDAATRYWQSSEWNAVRSMLGPAVGRIALDMGAGRGIASFALARDGFDVTALEPDPSELVGAGAIRYLAAHEGLAIRVVQEHSEHLPFADNTFDVVFARAVLHHTRDLRAACLELFRVLKPGGLLVAVREHVLSREEDLQRFLQSHPLHRMYGGEHAYLSTEYQSALRGPGFNVKVLRSFDSPINYFPQTDESLRQKLTAPLRYVPPMRKLANTLLSGRMAFGILRRVLSFVDNRPGRHHSFICSKPL